MSGVSIIAGVASATGLAAPVAGPVAVIAGLVSAAISCVDGLNFDCALGVLGLGSAGVGKALKYLPELGDGIVTGFRYLNTIWGYHVDFITLVNIYANYRRRELGNET